MVVWFSTVTQNKLENSVAASQETQGLEWNLG